MRVKVLAFSVAVLALAGNLYGQSVKRHPGDVLHYQIRFEGGDTAKVGIAKIYFYSPDTIPADQPGLTNGFQGNCDKSTATPDTFDCSLTIPHNVANGNYRLSSVDAVAGALIKEYSEDFHVPLVPIENSQTFNPPTKVIVTPKP